MTKHTESDSQKLRPSSWWANFETCVVANHIAPFLVNLAHDLFESSLLAGILEHALGDLLHGFH